MGALVLFNLLNVLKKRDNMHGLFGILLLFRNKYNKINNTAVRRLDSIYHITLFFKAHFWRAYTTLIKASITSYY